MDYCESLHVFPHRGRRRDDLKPGLRVTNHNRRVSIVFEVDSCNREVLIYRVHYGGQDYEADW